MTRNQYHLRCNNHTARQSRRGIAVAVLLLSLTLIFGLMGVTWNLAQLIYTHNQLQSACEAAALAGTPHLMDENQLRGINDPRMAILRSHVTAQRVAGLNVVQGRLVAVDANDSNNPLGDLVVGFVECPTHIHDPLLPWQGTGPINTLLVRTGRSQLRGNPMAMWLGQLFGVVTADVASSARATVDHRVYGFRPLAGTAVPVVPLGIDFNTWTNQSQATADAETNDCFAVDYHTGSVQAGSDGIAEIVLRAPLVGGTSGTNAQQSADVVQIILQTPDPGEVYRQQQLISGLRESDLAALGGLFVIGTGGTNLATCPAFDPSWGDALNTATGLIRAWPLGSAVNETNNDNAPGFNVETFAAAVIVDAWIDTQSQPSQLVITVQPAMLATSTALVADGVASNFWIAKLMLTQ